jgi:pimeloyl-ACP methyl ester carboxylesterase
MSDCSFLSRPDGRRIAHHLSEGALPGVVFMGGFKSDMTGAKALALEAYCRKRGQRFLRFDYTGHGQSSGKFIDGTIGSWKRDALDVLDRLVPGENILVGSSMGAWLALLAALEHKKMVVGLVGIASAPDFTEKLIWQQLKSQQQKQLLEEGIYHAPSCYGEDPYPITRALIEEGRNHLLLDGPIDLNIPVRLIHGTRDEDVPWQMATQLMERLASSDVALQLVKDGGHRLSEPQQLELICRTVDAILA